MSDLLIGGAIAIVSAVIASLLQRTSEHKRWLRAERLRVYYRLAEALHDAIDPNQDLLVAVEYSKPEGLSREQARPLLEAIDAQQETLSRLYFEMTIIASEPMRKLAEHLTVQAHQVTWWARQELRSGNLTEISRDYLFGFGDAEGYVEAARRDLGSDSAWGAMRKRMTRIRVGRRRRRLDHRAPEPTTRPDQ